MATSMQRGSAKIYDFPARGRFALNGHLDDSRLATSVIAPAIANIASGSAWYHEAAMREAELPRKN